MIFRSLGFICLLTVSLTAQELDLEWSRLADLPDPIGVASPFAGVVGSTLIVAGGANFPNQPPWKGGAKVWHDRVWALDKPDTASPDTASRAAAWREVGKLPRRLGYGISISALDGLLCIGGSDASSHYPDVFLLQLIEGQLVTKTFPALPRPIANASGALIGTSIYVAGGIESPASAQTLSGFMVLDLNRLDRGWQELETWPGPSRMLAVSAVVGDCFYLVSGVDLELDNEGKPLRKYLKDAYRYKPGTGWKRVADLSHACVAAPSPAPTFDATSFVIVGGDDGTKVEFQPMENHPGFSKNIFRLDTEQNKWSQVSYAPAPRVTAPIVKWGDRWWIISGEERPGVRSPQVWSFRLSRPQ